MFVRTHPTSPPRSPVVGEQYTSPLTDGGSEYLWGMPLEVAVGLMGLAGALIGAVFVGWVTRHVARQQRQHEIQMAELVRVRTAAVSTLTASTRLATAASSGDITEGDFYRFQEATTLLLAEAATPAPVLSTFVENALVRALEEAGVGLGGSVRPTIEMMSEGPAWTDMRDIAMVTRQGVLEWLSGRSPEPDFSVSYQSILDARSS